MMKRMMNSRSKHKRVARRQAQNRALRPLGQFNSVLNLPASRPKQSLGQNFLMHTRIAERIVNVSGVTSESVVFEIGPGTGMLTRELLKKVKKVIALEADFTLFEKVSEVFRTHLEEGRLEVIHGDIRTFALSSLPKEYAVVANIPYYLTGELFELFLSAPHQPISITFLVQKEVAERIARSKKESILSLSVKAYGTPKLEFTVPKGAFIPAPKVDSAVLTIKDISRNAFASAAHEARFFKLIHAAFAHKRKFVKNNLITAGFAPTDLPEKARAEDVPLTEWLRIAAT